MWLPPALAGPQSNWSEKVFGQRLVPSGRKTSVTGFQAPPVEIERTLKRSPRAPAKVRQASSPGSLTLTVSGVPIVSGVQPTGAGNFSSTIR